MRKAVIDVGSNSLLLVVGELFGSEIKVVCEDTRVTGLGEGTKSSGRLSEAGMERTLGTLSEFFLIAGSHGATTVRAAATMAARMATNTLDFQRRAKAQGTPVEVLSGEDEAELGFRAVANDPIFARSRRVSIIDPGGNSTELVTADRIESGWSVRFRRSYPIGTLGLRDGPLAAEALDSEAMMAGVREIDLTVGLEYLPGACGAVAVLGATGTNLVTIKHKMTHWEPERVHGQFLEFEEVSRSAGWLCRMTDAERAKVIGLETGREKTIHIGALILERFMHALHTADVAVSVRGWRHAMLDDLLRNG